MTDLKVVITGANSYLGQRMIRALAPQPGWQITGLVTPWCRRDGLDPGAEYIAADLARPLPAEAEAALAGADRVLHLAWIRTSRFLGPDDPNVAVADRLLEAVQPRRVVFLSSVAAFPQTPSVYGRAKQQAQGKIVAGGGSALVCGLVLDDPPGGSFALLERAVARLPTRLRFVLGTFRVYPVHAEDLVTAVRGSLCEDQVGVFRAYLAPGLTINRFLASLEGLRPRRRIGVLFVPAPLARGFARLFAGTAFGQKLVTFMWKADRLLQSYPEAPGLTLERTREALACQESDG